MKLIFFKFYASGDIVAHNSLLNLYLINIPKHIKLQCIKVIILVSFKIFNRENPINRINQLFTSTMLKSHLKFKSPKIKEIINKHINTCICTWWAAEHWNEPSAQKTLFVSDVKPLFNQYSKTHKIMIHQGNNSRFF